MSTSSEQIQVHQAPPLIKASDKLSSALGIPVQQMITTIKAQCFRGTNPDSVSDAQLAAFVSIANEMGVNPLLPGMLYAYPDRGAIMPMMGPDGVFKKLSEHPDVDSWETVVYPEDVALPPTHATTKIWRKNRERPIAYTALLSEWKVESNPNWRTRTRHMLGLRSLKQAARQVIHGLPHDEDERAIIGAQEINVTPKEEPVRKAAPERSKKGIAAVKENEKPVTVEAEVVDDKKPEPEKSAEPEKVVSFPTQEEPLKPTPESKKEPKRLLTEGEKGNFRCIIESFVAKVVKYNGADTPVVVARLKGEYEGEATHINGATIETSGARAIPVYQIEKPVVVSLLGRRRRDLTVGTVIEKIEIVAEDEF